MDIVVKSYSQNNYGAGVQAYYAIKNLNVLGKSFKHGGLNNDVDVRKSMRTYIEGSMRQEKSGVKEQRFWRHLAVTAPVEPFVSQVQPGLFRTLLSGYSSIASLPYEECCGSWIFPGDISDAAKDE